MGYGYASSVLNNRFSYKIVILMEEEVLMDKKQKKNFTVTVWDRMNKFLAVATILTTMIFIILFILCCIKDIGTPKHGFILGMCGVFASLASAFFIAWIIRIYDIKHKKEQEEKALTILQPYLKKIFLTIDLFFPQLKSFAIINDDDTIQYPNETIYYTDPNAEYVNRSFINLNEAFREAHSELEQNLQECLNAPILFQCNEEIAVLLTKLKLNGLTRNLFEIYKTSDEFFFSNTSFGSLYKNYNEFVELYETLAIVIESKPIGKLEELSDDAKKQYILEIENIKQQITSKHMGRIYKGWDRIQ